MIKIDYKVFNENLLLTQAYCDGQIKNESKNTASILRSINPWYNNGELLSFIFKTEPYNCYTTIWNLDIQGNGLLHKLYQKQLALKKETIKTIEDNAEYEGRILVAEIDQTPVDGASEAQSKGLIDGIDCPPIDTWFYQIESKNGRILFAWIPGPYIDLANKGVEVNCVDCLYWYDKSHWENYVWTEEKIKEEYIYDIRITRFESFVSRLKTLFNR